MSLTEAKPCPKSGTAGAELGGSPKLASDWYAAYTRPRHEKKVAEQLAFKQVETYLPLFASIQCWAGRKATVQMPLFPSYVFVRMSMSERVRVLEHPGVLHVVTFGGKPATLSDDEISRLRTALALRKAEPFPFLTAGKRIRIKSGPLRGLEGKIVRRKGRLRFVVTMDSIEKSIAFDLEASDLEPTN